jgi:fumarate hydratase subunit beta
MSIDIKTPLTKDKISSLKSGELVNISGILYTARDAAHKRMMDILDRGEALPINIKDQIFYYTGPSPAPLGKVIGSCGPTTSGRMDKYTPKLIELGLGGMIGKGFRDQKVIDSMIQHQSIYFGAIGGLGALISETIISEEVVLFHELGTEAVRKLEVKNFPAIVIIDCYGNNLYQTEKKLYEKQGGENYG